MMDSVHLKVAHSFTYLGICANNDGSANLEVSAPIRKAGVVYTGLHHLLQLNNASLLCITTSMNGMVCLETRTV